MITMLVLAFLSNKEYKTLAETNENNEIEIRRLTDVVADYEDVFEEKDKEIANLYTEIDVFKQAKVKYVGEFKIVYYCACEQCCGKTNGVTASGVKAQDGITIAADTSILPFGTKVYIEGVGERVVQDRGGAIKGNVVDVYVFSHDRIPSVGTHISNVWVVTE